MCKSTFLPRTDSIRTLAISKHVSVCHMSNDCSRFTLQTNSKIPTCPSCMISKGGMVPRVKLTCDMNTLSTVCLLCLLCLNFILASHCRKRSLKSPAYNVYTGYLLCCLSAVRKQHSLRFSLSCHQFKTHTTDVQTMSGPQH